MSIVNEYFSESRQHKVTIYLRDDNLYEVSSSNLVDDYGWFWEDALGKTLTDSLLNAEKLAYEQLLALEESESVISLFENEWVDIIHELSGVENLISPELKPLIFHVYRSTHSEPYNSQDVWSSLEKLLIFLCSSTGRTDANCRATDLFFCIANGFNWAPLPEEIVMITGDIGGALHDTMQYPEVAENFESLPEQLLGRLRSMPLN